MSGGVDDLPKYVTPSGELTEAGRALNESAQKWTLAVYDDLRRSMPRPAPDDLPAPGSGRGQRIVPPPIWAPDILAGPVEPEWLVAGLLPLPGTGVIGSKPKSGKSTLLRVLSLCIARGRPFLGRGTHRGTVLYFRLEAPFSEASAHFHKIGLQADDPIGIYDAIHMRGWQDRQAFMRAVVEEHRPVLVVIDTMPRFARCDPMDYDSMSRAFDPLIHLANEFGCHFLSTLHNKKAEVSDTADNILGSTAIQGSVDSILVVEGRGDETRYLSTVQRMGTDMERTALDLDGNEWVQLGKTKAETRRQIADNKVLDVIGSADAPMPVKGEDGIAKAAGLQRQAVTDSLNRLVERGLAVKSGAGRSGSPFLFSVPP